jgi:hypothetical protein
VISFRYHVVTIAAVFLALAVGLLGGGAFVQPALQDQLEQQTEDLKADNGALREQNDDLRLQIGGLAGFSETVLPYLITDRLVGVPVVVVTQVGVEESARTMAVGALEEAGAEVLTVVSASPLLVSEDPAVREQLAGIVGATDPASEDLSEQAAAAMAERLSSPAPPPEDDVLTQLLSGGFLAPIGAPPDAATFEAIGGPDQVAVVLSGGEGEEPALPPLAFAVPMVEVLGGLDHQVGAGESLASTIPYVSLLRSVGLDGVVTVDDVDLAMGGAALVLGLDRLLVTGQGGDYGVKDGAEPLPPLS